MLADGKFVKVKSYNHKIPVIYGVDYFAHDIPTYKLSRAENYQTCKAFFSTLKLLNYPLQALACDDNINIYKAEKHIYPAIAIQLCLNHFKENVRRALNVRTDDTYQSFMRGIEWLFKFKRSELDFDAQARRLVAKYQQDKTCINTLLEIARKKLFLLGYLHHKTTPQTTNLIESLNSHLEGRLKTIKGFESFHHADLWLNAYFLRRRTKRFSDCRGKFKRLNDKTPLQISQKPGADLPSFF